MRRLGLALLLLALPLACKKEVPAAPAGLAAGEATRSDAAQAPAPDGAAGEPAAPVPAALAPAPRVAARKLVRTVDLTLAVKATTEAAEAIQKMAVDLGGYVEAVNAERREDLLYYHLTVRVPVEKLDATVAAVKKLAARVDREQVKTEDMTDKYVDLDARVRTLRATERELQALLAESRQKNRGAKDIMEIYRELTGIRSQIEEIQAQLINLDKLASLSTLNVELVPTDAARPVAAPGWQPGETVRDSFRTLVSFLRWLIDALIFTVIVLVPVGLVLVLLWKLLRPFLPRRRGKRPEPPPPAE
jgi:hypothetical protein